MAVLIGVDYAGADDSLLMVQAELDYLVEVRHSRGLTAREGSRWALLTSVEERLLGPDDRPSPGLASA